MKKIIKHIGYLIAIVVSFFKPKYSTIILEKIFKIMGVNITGHLNYFSSTATIDGSNYSRVTIGEGCTISSKVRIMTHDWSLTTIGRGLGHDISPENPQGTVKPVSIGDYCFIGYGAILLPGTRLGRCCLVGAGSVVRGVIDDYSVVIGNPAVKIKDAKEYYCQGKAKLGANNLV